MFLSAIQLNLAILQYITSHSCLKEREDLQEIDLLNIGMLENS